jgi:tRNA dimethylallyltransferase
MVEDGLLEETSNLLAAGLPENAPASNSVGYREAIACLKGDISPADMELQIMSATRKLVTKQRKWFRKYLPSGSRFLLDEDHSIQPDDLIWYAGS